MYVRDPNKRGPLASGPAQSEQVVQTAQTPQHAVIQEDPSAVDMLKQQAMSKVGGTAIDKGMTKAGEMYTGSALESGVNSLLGPLSGSAASGTAGAGTAGAMAGLGAAAPFIGSTLLAGKLFGLFSEGGMVGPLAGVKYKSEGGEISTKHETTADKAKAEQGWFKTIWNTLMKDGAVDGAKKKLEGRTSKIDEAIKKSGG